MRADTVGFYPAFGYFISGLFPAIALVSSCFLPSWSDVSTDVIASDDFEKGPFGDRQLTSMAGGEKKENKKELTQRLGRDRIRVATLHGPLSRASILPASHPARRGLGGGGGGGGGGERRLSAPLLRSV